MRDEAEKRIGHLYPKAKLPDGSEATVIAWIWARTVRSPDPAAKGAMVPLASSFMLSTKEGKKAWVEPILDPSAPDGYRFEAKVGLLSKSEEDRLKKGTKSAKAQAFVCVLTGASIARDYIQSEGKGGRLRIRLMAVVAEGSRARTYSSPDDCQEIAAKIAEGSPDVLNAQDTFLSPTTPTRAMITGGVCSAYGLRTWGHLFTARQLSALIMFSDLVGDARKKVLHDAIASGMSDDEKPIDGGGKGALAYADAISTYISFIISQMANHSSNICGWNSTNTQMRSVFARQGFSMAWDFAEVNPFSESSGSFFSLFNRMVKGFDGISEDILFSHGSIEQRDAAINQYINEPIVVSTDPPYYDNIGYAVLSDFFYVWLRRTLHEVWSGLFRRLTTPKDTELVATPSRHGGKGEAEKFFMSGMERSLSAMRKAMRDEEPLTIYYAFKQAEGDDEGQTSVGWASFLQGVVDSGLGIDGTWPIDTEKKGRSVEIGANALASSIVLVCRKRSTDLMTATRAEFIRALKRELPSAIENLRKAGISPVDMPQSVIGPGMGVFGRFSKVMEDDDSTMPVRTVLALINRVWQEIDGEIEASLDPETQVALSWYAAYGFDQQTSGELIKLATPKDIALDTLFASGVFLDGRGKTGLVPRDKLPTDWTPATDRSLTVWECVQHTARVLMAEDGGQSAAARLVGQMSGSHAEAARALAYRLFEIATQKGWNQEALVYNELAQDWTRLEDVARTLPEQETAATKKSTKASAQGTLF